MVKVIPSFAKDSPSTIANHPTGRHNNFSRADCPEIWECVEDDENPQYHVEDEYIYSNGVGALTSAKSWTRVHALAM